MTQGTYSIMRQEVTHVLRVQLSGVCTCLTINTGHLKEPSVWAKRLGTDNGAAAVRTPAASGSSSNFHSPATSGSFRALRRWVSCAADAEKETQKMQQLAWSQDQSWDSLPPGSRITRRPCQHLTAQDCPSHWGWGGHVTVSRTETALWGSLVSPV